MSTQVACEMNTKKIKDDCPIPMSVMLGVKKGTRNVS